MDRKSRIRFETVNTDGVVGGGGRGEERERATEITGKRTRINKNYSLEIMVFTGTLRVCRAEG